MIKRAKPDLSQVFYVKKETILSNKEPREILTEVYKSCRGIKGVERCLVDMERDFGISLGHIVQQIKDGNKSPDLFRDGDVLYYIAPEFFTTSSGWSHGMYLIGQADYE
jgi:hypothetical protein